MHNINLLYLTQKHWLCKKTHLKILKIYNSNFKDFTFRKFYFVNAFYLCIIFIKYKNVCVCKAKSTKFNDKHASIINIIGAKCHTL